MAKARQGMSKKKEIKLRVSEDLYNSLKNNMSNQGISVNRRIVELLKQQITIIDQPLLTEKQNKTILQKKHRKKNKTDRR